MKKLLIVVFLNNLLFAYCTLQEEQKANNLWKESQYLEGMQRYQKLQQASKVCGLEKIDMDRKLFLIDNELKGDSLTLEQLYTFQSDLSDLRSIENTIRSGQSSKIENLNHKIVTLLLEMEKNQEKLDKLNAYMEGGEEKGFGEGERLLIPVVFPHGKSYVKKNRSIKSLVKKIKATIKKNPYAQFTITGYASSPGSAKGNKRLSKKRARNTKKYIEKYISNGHIDVDWKGESDLICNGGFSEKRSRGNYACLYGTENEASSRRIEVLRRR